MFLTRLFYLKATIMNKRLKGKQEIYQAALTADTMHVSLDLRSVYLILAE